MKVNFGLDAYSKKQGLEKPVVWDIERAVSPHMLIVGMTGAGKSHALRNAVRSICASSTRRVRFHVFDVHGDLNFNGASTVQFSEGSECGLNPLVINPDRHFGGVRKCVANFISVVTRVKALGSKQEAVLRALLYDLFAANGYFHDDPDSWSSAGTWRGRQKNVPNIDDLLRFAQHKLKTLYLGSDQAAMLSLEKLNKSVVKLQRSFVDAQRGAAQGEEDSEVLKMKEKCIKDYSDYISAIKSGRELNEIIRYDSRDVLKSVVERIENLSSIGIFKRVAPPFDPRAQIHRYDLVALSHDERRLFVAFRLEEIFRRMVQTGEKPVEEFVILDEAHLYADDDPLNIVNVVAKEARKFGLGLIAASQSPTHYSEDFLTAVATKVILRIDEMFWEKASRRLMIDMAGLKWLRPRKNMLVQSRSIDDEKNEFKWVVAV